MLFFCSVAGQVDTASKSCALGAAVLLVAVFLGGWEGGPRVPLSEPLQDKQDKQLSLWIFPVWTLQRGVLAWLCGHIPRAMAPPLRFGGGGVVERPWFSQVPLPPSPSLETVSGFTPNLSLSGTCLRFSAMSDTSKTR